MPASPVQFDVNSGVDLTSIDPIPSSTLLQAINQIAPLSNIGGIIAFSGAGGTLWPGVTNNPRFEKYLWLDLETDTPTMKLWDGSADTYAAWVAVGLSDGSVDKEHIVSGAVTLLDSAGTDWRLRVNYNGSPNAGRTNHLVVTDSSGQKIITDSIANVLDGGVVPIGALIPGTDGQYIKMVSGVWTAQTINFANELAAASVNASKLSPSGGSPGFFFRVNSAGAAVEVVSNDDSVSSLFPALSIGLNKLANGGASAGDILRFNGTNWVKFTPAIDLDSSLTISTTGHTFANDLTDANQEVDHLLGAIPKFVRCVVVCQSGEHGYSVGDELEVAGVWTTSGAGTGGIQVSADGAKIYVTVSTGTITCLDKVLGTLVNLTKASWKPKVYAIA